MAAFSYQDPYFPMDSVFMANSATKSSVFGNECFPTLSQLYPSFGLQKQPMIPQAGSTSITGSGLESSCLEQQSVSNEPSVAEKQSFASMADNKTESGEQVCQNLAPLDKKRKSRNGSFSNSGNSKDAKQVKCKKQKGEKEALKENAEKNNKTDQNQGTEEPPKGYIHVRARRGQATDSHSLAERVRREKISERMKMLQALVPGCDKVTGKALMLDEIINYVQSLQTQVELLSMKLASLDPMVYTFGLMDLHPMAFGTEEMNNDMGLQIPLMQPTSSSGSTAFSDSAATNGATTTATATIGAAFPSPVVDSSATMLQEDQKPTLEDGRSLYWGMDEEQQQQQQRQSIINQFGFGANNNLYSFH